MALEPERVIDPEGPLTKPGRGYPLPDAEGKWPIAAEGAPGRGDIGPGGPLRL